MHVGYAYSETMAGFDLNISLFPTQRTCAPIVWHEHIERKENGFFNKQLAGRKKTLDNGMQLSYYYPNGPSPAAAADSTRSLSLSRSQVHEKEK